nr:acyltransferase [Mesorhizobium sp.]
MRGCSALVVMMSHLRAYSLPAYGALPFTDKGLLTALFYTVTRPGHAAVMIFFVLSGFLVGGQVLRHLREGRFDVLRYSIDRGTRILVPLVPALLLSAIVAISVGVVFPIEDIAAHIVGLNGVLVATTRANAPLWSLSYEIWFYVLMGCVGYAISRRFFSILAIAGLAASALIFSVLDSQYLFFWLLGAFFAAYPPRSLWVAYISAAAFVGGMFLSQMVSEGGPWAGYAVGPADTIMCFGLATLLPALCHERVNRVLQPAALAIRGLSAMSYSLYIFHYPLLVFLTFHFFPVSPGLTGIAPMAAKGALLFVACGVFYVLFERRTVAIRSRLSAMLTKQVPA